MRTGVAVWVLTLTLGTDGAPQRQTAASSADEAKIRELVAAYDGGAALPRTDDIVFWSGAFKRPVVGSMTGEAIPTDREPSLRVAGTQRNRTTVLRIEIATSADIAYEYSNSVLTFQLKNGRTEELQTSLLRVWKKVSGEWKVAAMFARPHYQEPSPSRQK